MTNRPKIFVAMPSYRDPECQHTVKNLFEKAAYPERIFVGICWQYDKKTGQDERCFKTSYPRPEQVRVIEHDYRDARGASWGRAQAMRLKQDEEYVLLSEPHVRFTENWDEMLLSMLDNCPSSKPVLTALMPHYTLPDILGRPDIVSLSYKGFHKNGIALVQTSHVPDAIIPTAPFPSPVLLVSNLFAKAKLFEEVPIDPYIYFEGDETSYSARVWTHGWDIFCMNEVTSYHLWERSTRPLHWKDEPEIYEKLAKNSTDRFKHLFGMEKTINTEALQEIEKYRFGNTRSFAEYQKFANVDFTNHKIHDQSRWVYQINENSNLRPAPPLLQGFIIKQLRSWVAECMLQNADLTGMLTTTVNLGLDVETSINLFKEVVAKLGKFTSERAKLNAMPRLTADAEDAATKKFRAETNPAEIYDAFLADSHTPENIKNSILKIIYDHPYKISGDEINQLEVAAEFANNI